MTNQPSTGKPVWHDLTVPDADTLRDFYAAVLGLEVHPVDMGGYSDYAMQNAAGDAVGVCHARGPNAKIPPVWMVYFSVADIDAAIHAVQSAGGQVIDGPRNAGGARICIIRDPAGAYAGLAQA